jgi:uncharacterized protein YbaP (TraB family)
MTDPFRERPSRQSRRDFLVGLAALTGVSWTGRLREILADGWPLYAVEGNGHRVYLMGETPPRPVSWHDSRIEALVPKCSVVWTETNDVYKQKVQDLIARYGVDQAHPLATWLTDTDQERLARVADLAHVPVASLATYRPWVAGGVLEDSYYSVMHMADAAQKVLVAEAQSASVRVSSEFPTKDDVMAWFGDLTPEQDVQFLRYSLDMILAGEAENSRIFTAWSHGDSGPADARVAGFKTSYPDLYPKLVVERNKAWVPRFTAMLANQTPALVITGLYHLARPDSLLHELRDAGLSVRAV